MIKKILYAFVILMVIGAILDLFDDGEKKQSISKTKEPTQTAPKKNVDMKLVEALKKKDCAEFIVCLSAKKIAKEYGRTEMWAVANYEVNVWEKTSANGKGKNVGKMRCNSRALIIDRSGEDYKILSPLDKSIGWVNKVQIENTIYQNPNTYEDCEG